jgi:PAS domain S-box-containing protein
MDKVMNMLPCGFLTTTEKGKITFINKYLLDLLLIKEGDVVGKKLLHDFFPVGVRMYFETHVNPLLQMQRSVEEISIELVRSDNFRIPVLLQAIIKTNEGDNKKTVHYTFFDISQRKKYERELLLAAEKEKELSLQLQATNMQIKKDNAYYKSIIENKSFYIIKADLAANFTYLNPAYCKRMGIEEDDLLGKSALTFVLPEDHHLAMESTEAILANPDGTSWINLRVLSPAGILTFQWETCLLRNEELNVSELLCIGHDVTPLIKKQEELQALNHITTLQNQRLNNFTYITSHNIRSHVSNLIGLIDGTDIDDPQDTIQSFNMLRKSVIALDETIRDLNNVISIQDNTGLPKRTLNVKDEIDKVIQIIQHSLSASKAAVYYNLPDHNQLRTNPAYFESILLNLLTNAIKYRSLDRNPEISITMAKAGNYNMLVVRDNGLGIDLDRNQDQLFGMYKTFHGNKDAKGIGLFITKTQIDALRGKIEVESVVGVGTVFKVYFPDT